jgi:hypothetical protein
MSMPLWWFKSSYSSSAGGECVEVAYNWRKSSHSGATGNCLQVAACSHTVHVRDSKNPAGPVLTLTPAQWAAFVDWSA